MAVTLDDEQFALMTQALDQADGLVTAVIKGDPKVNRSALEVARTLNDLRRKYPPPKRSDPR